MLNSNQIINENLLKLEDTKGKQAQVGYDLSIKSLQKVDSSIKIGKILKDKTEIAEYIPVEMGKLDDIEGYFLYAGVYDVTFHEGCKIPNNRTAFIKQRSSLYRNGAIINSPIFDPGFETNNMGTLMYVFETIFIEKDARIAQMYFHENSPLDESQLYNGQFMMDKQRYN